MNRRFISVLMFAFVVAGGASLVLYKLVIGHVSTSAPAAATSSILVAAKNLDLGSVISDGDLRVTAWPGTVPEGAIVKMADAIGRGITAPIYANEPVTASRLGEKGAGGGLAATIPPGMRAVAIRVNEIVGVAGFVVAGTHVDVLVSGNSGQSGSSGGNATRTLLQDISVLSAGQDFKKDTEGKPIIVQVVNLLVTPEQAEMLSLAGSQMTVQLVLRNPLDKTIATIPAVSLASIFSGEATPVARGLQVSRSLAVKHPPVALATAPAFPPAVPEVPQMEIISGSSRTQVKLHKTEVR
jgi:pilus assembly protein CpaB